ncbi:MAG TPA: bifunctional UDP-N-acetylglucosamine diphosphorylase/glucosamine-1-phosphate N-acetyltransferase GlmU [Bryobacteraceae bacterium]|nr:bifunctional UDP-N-acetylglucosamine diphosphorylase/glucosamine-1-phosphate N-acetyltransferase GlmU [Bryobacteraceae bacterium]
METALTVVILAAGLGTRMKSRKAKVLHRAGGRYLVEHVLRSARALAPPERIFVVVGHQSAGVRAALASPEIGLGVNFIEQAEQKGTGHALMVAAETLAPLGGRIVILYGDCPLVRPETLKGLVAALESSDVAGVILTAIMDDPTGYGRVLRDGAGRITGVVEQRAGSPEQLAIREANMGLYCYHAAPFWAHVQELRPDNPAREYYLTDMVEILHRAGHAISSFRIDDPREVLGINDRAELAVVDRLLRERKVRELMLAGVTVEKPETVTIDPDVTIGMDTVVEPFAQILGHTTIGENCRIGACSIIRDSELHDDVEVGQFTIVVTSRLERAAQAGPFARLRMEDYLGPGAHVGNFVELKKTRLGPGSKAMHLTYLGDSQIGAHVNVGAGTITCNYDGFRKHPTKIGAGAFIGSNSILVAPVEIGEGAYLAAGSVITDDVPADALGVARSRQVNREDWARKRRELGKKP